MGRFFNFFSQEIAIDLGTANTLIIYNDQIVVDEPSIVAVDRNTNEIIAVGKKAMMMHEKTHQKNQDHSSFKRRCNSRF